MPVSQTLLDACFRFAGDVSPELVDEVIKHLELGDIQTVSAKLIGDAGAAFIGLRDEWNREGMGDKLNEVALLLRGTANSIQTERAQKRVELVWSGPLALRSPLRSTEPALLELLNSARESVYLVTFAAYRVPAIAAAIGAALSRGVRVVFVLESDDSSAGKVDFDPLPYLGGVHTSSIEVYEWPLSKRSRDDRGHHGTLHAKFAVADKSRLLVSSANLTEFAFKLNIELGMMVTGGDAARQAVEHMDALILEGVLQRLRD
jgi:phosphatidylserine/phosphatidylglycerophosphate/cardiolipin synthase-like enzyme